VLSVNERWLEILLAPMRDQITVAEMCRRYGITRQTFYVYQRRFYADGREDGEVARHWRTRPGAPRK
jgi:hypothetical protein